MHPNRKALLSPFSHVEIVSKVKDLTQGSTARDPSTSRAHHLPSTAHSSAWSSLPQSSFFYSEAGGHWGDEREVMDRRGECSCLILSTIALCVFQEHEYLFPFFILLLLNSDPSLP